MPIPMFYILFATQIMSANLKKLPLDNNQKGSLTIADFGAKQLR